VHAAAVASFDEAHKLIDQLTGIAITPRHLQDLTHEIGTELAAARDQRTDAYREQPLNTPPRAACPPMALAVVMTDGGRMQTRQPARPSGVHAPHWRETKTAVLLRMTEAAAAVDPHPELPRCFARPLAEGAPTEPQDAPSRRSWGPRPLLRTGLASLCDSERFGWMLAAEADRRGFHSAAKGAYLGDGQAYNWSIQRTHFASFTPILDFVHAAEHVHEAAKAAGDPAWGPCWAEACWQGRVEEVLLALEAARDRLEAPTDRAAEPEHPWCVLDRTRGYLEQNRERMDYPRYRREGLPITSSPVESWIKQLNQRVKGSDRFWEDGRRGEAILQVRVAWQGEDEALREHLDHRPGHPYSRPRAPSPQAA
jgi:hypothetical protein